MGEIVFDPEFMSLDDKIGAIERRAPDRILKAMDKEGNTLRRELRDATPVGKDSKGKKRSLKSGWTAERARKEYGTYIKKIRNKSPHYHLVERGHRIVSHRPKKVVSGEVGGRYFAEKVLGDYEPVLEARYEKMIDGIMGDIFG